MTIREEELVQEGWQRRFVAAEPRVSEMAELYKETGFEVHLEPLSAVEEPDKSGEECKTCFEGFEDQYKVIYTREKGGESEEG